MDRTRTPSDGSGKAVRAVVLVLAGTTEGTALARRLAETAAIDAAVAVLGDGAAPPFGAPVARIGPVAGVDDLLATIGRTGATALVDASDPFDHETGRLVRLACLAAGLPRLRLLRAPWPRHPLDRRIEVDGAGEAARVLPDVARRALLALPEDLIDHFAGIDGVHGVALLDRAPRRTLPGSVVAEVDPGPYTLAGEQARLARHGAQVVVLRATGDPRHTPLLAAARGQDMPVLMLRRPLPGPGARAETVDQAVDWVASVGRAAGGPVSSATATP